MPDRCPRCGYKFNQDKDFRKKVQEDYPAAFRPWKPAEDATLEAGVKSGVGLLELSRQLGRQPTAVKARIEKLGLAAPVATEEPEQAVSVPADTRPL